MDLYSNNAQTTLTTAGGIGTSDTAFTVASSTGFPSVSTGSGNQFIVLIDQEYIAVTNVTGQTWTVVRGVEGTLQSHLVNAPIRHYLSSGNLGRFAQLGAASLTFTGNTYYWNTPIANFASANYGRFNIGAGGFAGGGTNFSGSSSGTEIAINSAVATGNFIDFQQQGVWKFRLDKAGNASFVGNVNVGSLNINGTTPLLQIGGAAGNVNQLLASGGGSATPTWNTLSGRFSTSTNTIDLAASGVTANSYISPNITVDTYGRITSATNTTILSTANSWTAGQTFIGSGSNATPVIVNPASQVSGNLLDLQIASTPKYTVDYTGTLVAGTIPLARLGSGTLAAGILLPSTSISGGILASQLDSGSGNNGKVLTGVTSGAPVWSTIPGTGTVTSVSAITPPFAVTNPTTTPSIIFATSGVGSNTFLAGPIAGGGGGASMRALDPADLPLATASAFGAVKPDGSTISVSGGVISSSAGFPYNDFYNGADEFISGGVPSISSTNIVFTAAVVYQGGVKYSKTPATYGPTPSNGTYVLDWNPNANTFTPTSYVNGIEPVTVAANSIRIAKYTIALGALSSVTDLRPFGTGPTRSLYLNVVDWGMVPNSLANGAANLTILNRMLSYLFDQGGGTIYFPIGAWYINGQIVFPGDGTGNTLTALNAGKPDKSPSFRLTGSIQNGPGNNQWPASQLLIRYSGISTVAASKTPTDAKILCFANTLIEIDHLALISNPASLPDYTPMVYVTNSVLRAHDLYIQGPNGDYGQSDIFVPNHYLGKAPYMDGFVFGSTDTTSSVPTNNTTRYSQFSGYNTDIRNVQFDYVRRGFVFGASANQITIGEFFFSSSCGNVSTPFGPAIDFSAPNIANAAPISNTIRNGGAELTSYNSTMHLASTMSGANTNNFVQGIKTTNLMAWDPVGSWQLQGQNGATLQYFPIPPANNLLSIGGVATTVTTQHYLPPSPNYYTYIGIEPGSSTLVPNYATGATNSYRWTSTYSNVQVAAGGSQWFRVGQPVTISNAGGGTADATVYTIKAIIPAYNSFGLYDVITLNQPLAQHHYAGDVIQSANRESALQVTACTSAASVSLSSNINANNIAQAGGGSTVSFAGTNANLVVGAGLFSNEARGSENSWEWFTITAVSVSGGNTLVTLDHNPLFSHVTTTPFLVGPFTVTLGTGVTTSKHPLSTTYTKTTTTDYPPIGILSFTADKYLPSVTDNPNLYWAMANYSSSDVFRVASYTPLNGTTTCTNIGGTGNGTLLTLSSVANVYAGTTYLRINSSGAYGTNTEIAKVKTIAGNVVTLNSPLYFSYGTGAVSITVEIGPWNMQVQYGTNHPYDMPLQKYVTGADSGSTCVSAIVAEPSTRFCSFEVSVSGAAIPVLDYGNANTIISSDSFKGITQFNSQLRAPFGISTFTKPGSITDTDFRAPGISNTGQSSYPVDGTIASDTLNKQLWVRQNNVWNNVPTTGSTTTWSGNQLFTKTPDGTNNYGSISLGNQPFSGGAKPAFQSANSVGTYLAINGTYNSGADLINAQAGGNSFLRIANDGTTILSQFTNFSNVPSNGYPTIAIGTSVGPNYNFTGGAVPHFQGASYIGINDPSASPTANAFDFQVQGVSKFKVDANGITSAMGYGQNTTTVTTTPYPVLPTDSVILVNAASRTITLPAATGTALGRIYTVKNTGSGTNTTVGSAGGTIDGATTYTGLSTAYSSAQFISDTNNWYIV